MLVVLGLTSSIFFVLILVIHYLKRRWQQQDMQQKQVAEKPSAGLREVEEGNR